ncbi:MAG: FHA domain-containing protein [Kofleriaceae bacterium]
MALSGVTYRDSFDTCPRCTAALEDAGSARGCRTCGGLWLDEAVLEEMVLAMRPGRPLDRLELDVVARAAAPLACPACGDPMQATEVHEIPIDRCAKHGVWFDKTELELALRSVAERGLPEPKPRAEPPVPRPTVAAAPVIPSGPGFTFVVEEPGDVPRSVHVDRDIVKIGRLKTAQVMLTDHKVSRMHAVIEVRGPDDLAIIDLGSAEGTLVNGKRINRSRLRDGDSLQLGDTVIRVAYTPRG